MGFTSQILPILPKIRILTIKRAGCAVCNDYDGSELATTSVGGAILPLVAIVLAAASLVTAAGFPQ